MAIKFNKHNVTNGATKARVFYSRNGRIDGRDCVTLYAKDFGGALAAIFAAEYKNQTDSQSDCFDQGKAVLFADHPLYKVALARAEANGR